MISLGKLAVMGGILFLGASLPGQGGSQYSPVPDPKMIRMPTPRMVLPLHVTTNDIPAKSPLTRCPPLAQYGGPKCKALSLPSRWIG